MLVPLALAAILSVSLNNLERMSGASASRLETSSLRAKSHETILPPPALSIPDTLFFLSPGDGLMVRWWGIGSGNEELVVDTRHDLLIPEVGRINVRRLNLGQVRDSVEAIIRKRMRADLVDLQVVRVTEARVAVAGFAPSGGVFLVPVGARASQVLSLAGVQVREQLHRPAPRFDPAESLKGAGASMRRVRLLRSRGDSSWLDMAKAFNQGVQDQDPPLFTGDVVRLLPVGNAILLNGKVPHSGLFEMIPGESLASLLLAAGVVQVPDSVMVSMRSGSIVSIPVSDPVDTAMVLIHVPHDRMTAPARVVWVLGHVVNPGPVASSVARDTREAIAAAGGSTVPEDSQVVVSIRSRWGTTTAARSPRTLESFQNPEIRLAMMGYVNRTQGTYSRQDVALGDGDTIWVHAAEPVVWVGGEVRRPGFVPWAKDRSRDEYIDLAGGHAGRPWKSKTVVFDLYTEQQVRGTDPIRPGAAIIVPEKKYIDPLTWLAAVGTIVSLFVTAGTFYITSTQ